MGNEAKQGKVVCSIKSLNPSTTTEKVKCVIASQPITNAIVIPEFNEIVVLTASETKSLKDSVEKYDQYIKDIQKSYASKDARTIGDAKNKLAEFMAVEAKKSAKTSTKKTDKSETTNNDRIIDKFIEIIELDGNKYSYAPVDLIASFRRSGTQKTLDLKNLKSIKAIASGSAGPITKTATNADSSTTSTNGGDPTVVDPETREKRFKDRFKEVKGTISHDWLGPENKPYETQVKMEAILKFVGVGESDISKKSLEWAKSFDGWVEKTNGELKWTMQDRDIRRKKLVTLLDPRSTPAQRGISELKDQTILTYLQDDVDSIWGVYLTDTQYKRTATSNYDLGGIKKFIKEIEGLTWNTYAINAATLQRNCDKWAKYIDIWLTPTQRHEELNSVRGTVSYGGIDYRKKTALAEKLRAKAEDVKLAISNANKKEENSKKENGAIFEEEALGLVKNEIEYIWDNFDNDFVTKINKITWSEFSGSGDDAVLIQNRNKLLANIKDKQLPPYYFNVSASAQFMRFTAGKSVVSNFDPAKGRVGLKAEAKVDLALAEGKFNVQYFMPDDQGVDLSFESTGKYDVIKWIKTDTVYAKLNTFRVDKVFLLPKTMSMLSVAMQKASWETRLVNQNTASHAIQVIGHTDPDGGAEYNMDLSIRRAKVAYEFLTYQYDAWYQRFVDGTWGDKEILAMVKELSGSSKKGRLQDSYWSDIINKKLHDIVSSSQYNGDVKYIGYQVNCSLIQPISKPKPPSGKDTKSNSKSKNRLGTITISEKQYLKLLIKAYMRKASDHMFLLKTSFMEQAYDGRGLTELKTTNRVNFKDNRRVEVHLNKSVNTTTKEVTKKIPFGHIRLQIEAYITGYAGANAAASAELGFGSAKGESQTLGVSSGNAAIVEEQAQPQGMSGSTTNSKSNTASTKSASYGTAGDDVDGLDLQLGGFAGASATPGIKALLEWKCPKPDLTIQSSGEGVPKLECSVDNNQAAKVIKVAGLKNEFAELASVGLSVTGSAGIGFAGEFKLGFDTDTGKFLFKIKIGVTCGFGAGGSFEFAVGAKNVYWLIRFVHAQLNDHNFNYLDFFEKNVYEMYSAWSFELYKNGFNIAGDVVENIGEAALFGGKILRDIKDWWDDHETSIDIAQALAIQIDNDNALLTYMSPDVKARIIDNLCVDGWFSADVAQEKAIIKVLNTLKSKKEFNEILERMSGELPNIGDPYQGAFVTKESRQNIKAKRIISNKKKLLEMLDGTRHEQFIELQKSLPDEAPKMTKA